MVAFATASELASFVQADVDTSSANLALDSASAAIRQYAGWNIDTETVTARVFEGPYTTDPWLAILYLPTRKLTAVGPVLDNGAALGSGQYAFWIDGRVEVVARGYTWRRRRLTITYTHGFATTDPEYAAVKDVCLRMAGRRYQNPGALRSETVGSVSWTLAGTSPGDHDDLVSLPASVKLFI